MSASEAPHQGDETVSQIEVYPEFADGLTDIDGFSHLHVFYWLDRSRSYDLMVKTPWDDGLHGLFATRSPGRVNPIGYAVAELIRREGNILIVKYLDAVDKTPVLDIKPYIPEIDAKKGVRRGWFEKTGGLLRPRIYEYESSVEFVKGKEFVLGSPGKPGVTAGCAVEFGGRGEYWSPQHLFIAAIEACIATTFLWLLEKNGLSVISYRSKATGRAHLKNKDFVFSGVVVEPVVKIDDGAKEGIMLDLMDQAAKECMVSKSINCPVVVKPVIEKQI
jgi:formylmethanofuran dehydrogenase subunit E